MSIEATVNKNYTDVARGYSISFGNIRRGWYRFLERCEDYWDLFTIWLHRNEPTMPLREFMEQENKKRGLSNV
ncbi:hypothetical protein [Candidatus Symbiothrix dinenymphae]|uniref:hypothetical protein n=1 Tax=Candidatus Symbiothrix dinenymphae TaxID=467085 RepID=UPI0006E1CB30|nr:hypothetical protein [Candidatus Symbiothrix dinenymphae]